MEERWDPERDDPEMVALLEAFLVNHVLGTRNRFSWRDSHFPSSDCFLTIILNSKDYLRPRREVPSVILLHDLHFNEVGGSWNADGNSSDDDDSILCGSHS